MAQSLTLTSKLTHTLDGSTITAATTTFTIVPEVGIDGFQHHTVQSVTTTREALSVGDVDTASSYWVQLRNMDATNFVAVESYDGVNYTDCGMMYPGEPWGPCRIPSGHTLHLDADTATCKVEVLVCEAGVPA